MIRNTFRTTDRKFVNPVFIESRANREQIPLGFHCPENAAFSWRLLGLQTDGNGVVINLNAMGHISGMFRTNLWNFQGNIFEFFHYKLWNPFCESLVCHKWLSGHAMSYTHWRSNLAYKETSVIVEQWKYINLSIQKYNCLPFLLRH